jgi:glucosamine--fructose-6-phosphate aminotransferase (isomerizing)
MASRLATEARQTANGARAQLARVAPVLAELASRLRAKAPALVVTAARGSSDHAATYGKYILETTTDAIVASVGPSIASMYHRAPRALAGSLVLAVSQSGRSPDLLALAEAAQRGGALVVAIVNDEGSPLAHTADLVVPLCAGDETAVAATKSYLLSCLAFLQLAAAWSGDRVLHAAVAAAPDVLDAGVTWDLTPLAGARSLYVVARGIGLGAASEMALKLKETCRLHAEAFSTAEVLHGPVALVEDGFPVIAIAQPDETERQAREVFERLASLGATVVEPPLLDGVPAVLAPLVHVLRFYLGLPALAALRGLDADVPAHLSKITKTR